MYNSTVMIIPKSSSHGTSGRRTTKQLRVLANYIINCIDGDTFYGYEVLKGSGLSKGTLYQMLSRLEEMGWLRKIKPSEEERTAQPIHRPARNFYKLTQLGQKECANLITERGEENSQQDSKL